MPFHAAPLWINTRMASFCNGSAERLTTPVIWQEPCILWSHWKPNVSIILGKKGALCRKATKRSEYGEQNYGLVHTHNGWYPVAATNNLYKALPNAVPILGRDPVVWWDKHGLCGQAWKDECPRRSVALSKGRINERGHVECSGHGWSFAPSAGSRTLNDRETSEDDAQV
ncbi:hypothetical protein KP509_01G051200 [Ceratopteris richardii]|uniref:Rieske domain-containing protein n=1 Tax=Ceratopteris richardii TaxID=49495 RepID=A0A8T2VKK3_CERRI|nr:hypothetical protein KP509_01G051200 [Ceratopteris richardii]